MNIDITDKREQRNFGLLIAVASVVIGCVRWAIHGGGPPLTFVYVAVGFLVLGIALPRALQPVLYLWIKFALLLNWVMTRLLLTLVWYLAITPTGLFRRLFAEDPLHRKWPPDGESFWEEPDDQPDDLDSYFNQF